jgi:hypothetical protein
MHMATWPHHATVHGNVCVKWVLHNITPTHKGEHEVMSIQTIIMRTSTPRMQAMANLLRGPHITQARTTRPKLYVLKHVAQVGALTPITTDTYHHTSVGLAAPSRNPRPNTPAATKPDLLALRPASSASEPSCPRKLMAGLPRQP